MNFNRYYQDEIAYLRELGAEFARQNPDLAPYLSTESRDPDVERLIEAFAFLTGRLREQIDEELPEFIHALLAVLWPQALRPLPCMTVMRFDPVRGALPSTEPVVRGVEIRSRVVEGVRCSFRTTSDIKLQPFNVTNAAIEEVAGNGLLRITLTPVGDIDTASLDFAPLRFFLNFHADGIAGSELRLLLRRHVRSIRITTRDGQVLAAPNARFEPAGFAPSEALLQPGESSFDSLRLLQEGLSYPEKFHFLDLVNLPGPHAYGGDEFSIIVEFNQAFKTLTRLSAGHINLNCAPAINMFEADAEPIAITRRLTEYRLSTTDPAHMDVVHVLSVVGWARGRSEHIRYDRFEAFHRRPRSGNPTFYVRLKASITRRKYEHYLSFSGDKQGDEQHVADLALARILCCNGNLPELLGLGDVSEPGENAPLTAKPRNVTPITPYVIPPLNAMDLWSVISIMARNYYPIGHVEGLRNLVTHLNFRAFTDRQAARRQELLVQALLSVRTEACDMIVKGCPVRGRHIILSVNEDDMEGLGRAFLFGDVLNHFLGLFANINSCHRFSLHCTRSNMTYDWPMRMGTVPTL